MIIYAIIAAVASVVIDQLTKLWFYGSAFSVLGDFLWVQSTFNDGAAFGLFGGARWFFIILSIPVIAGLIYCLISKILGDSPFLGVTLGLMAGGIIGNVIDRIILGGVRDFIYFKSINFAIFNFADAFICVSVALLAIYLLFCKKHKKDNKESRKDDDDSAAQSNQNAPKNNKQPEKNKSKKQPETDRGEFEVERKGRRIPKEKT